MHGEKMKSTIINCAFVDNCEFVVQSNKITKDARYIYLKIKEGVFVGSQIREVMQDVRF
jgi:hypothetical protein